MRQIWKNGFPAVLAFLAFIVVAIIYLLGIIPPEQWGKFEMISNGVMFIIAMLGLFDFFLKWRSSQMDSDWKKAYIISNGIVSSVACYMNINVFQHTIRLEHPLEDIWCIHLLWLLCIALQILLLTGLGKAILNVVRSLLAILSIIRFLKAILNVIHSFLGEMKKAVKRLWGAACDLMNRADNYVLCALFFSFISWSIYIGIQIYNNRETFVSTGNVIFSQSVWFWSASLLICLMVRIFPPIIQKAAEGVNKIKDKIMLGVIVIVALAGLAYVLSAFLIAIAMLILIPLTLIFILYFGLRKLSLTGNESGNGSSETGNLGEREDDEGLTIKKLDLIVVLLPFIASLFIIFVIAALQPEARDIFAEQNSLSIDTFLSFVDKILEIAPLLLELVK